MPTTTPTSQELEQTIASTEHAIAENEAEVEEVSQELQALHARLEQETAPDIIRPLLEEKLDLETRQVAATNTVRIANRNLPSLRQKLVAARKQEDIERRKGLYADAAKRMPELASEFNQIGERLKQLLEEMRDINNQVGNTAELEVAPLFDHQRIPAFWYTLKHRGDEQKNAFRSTAMYQLEGKLEEFELSLNKGRRVLNY